MDQVKEPATSYTTDEDGNTYEVTEYGLEDKYLLMDAFEDPNYTQIPNQLLGSWERDNEGTSTFIIGMLANMSEAELKVCLALCRLTYGFHRERTRAALSLLQKMTGMSRQGVLNGIERLTDRGLFSKEEGAPRTTTKWIRGDAEKEPSQRSRPALVNEVDQTSQRSRPYKESIKKGNKDNRLSSANPAEDYTVTHYYKSAEVAVLGTRTKGPWSVVCLNCLNDVKIDALETAVECLCGYHQFILTKHRPKAELPDRNEAVEAYLLITGRKRNTIAKEWLDKIESTVTDIPFWRQVVTEYCGLGWNRGNITTMLQYYEENRLPGTRKKKEADGPREEVIDGKKTLVYDEAPRGPTRWTRDVFHD